MSILLVFDVETTGLPPSRHSPTGDDVCKWPHITQLSALLYDTEAELVLAHLNYYVRIPVDVHIPDRVVEITGITDALCQEKGLPIRDVLLSFYEMYTRATHVVAHNYAFDSSMMQAELLRHGPLLPPYCRHMFSQTGVLPVPCCTMLLYQYYCGILHTKSLYRGGFIKYPKLAEIYDRVFQGNKVAADYGLHNSMVDTLLCFRFYLCLERRQHIDEAVFQYMLDAMCRPMVREQFSVSSRTRRKSPTNKGVLQPWSSFLGVY